MHASAIRALKVVEIDHCDFGRWIAAHRPPCSIDIEGRFFGEVECLQARQRFAIRGDQEIERCGLCPAGESDGQRFIAGKLARLSRANRYGVILGDIELRPNQHFYATICLRVGRVLLSGLGLAANREAKCDQASEESKTQQNGQPLKKG